MKKLLYSPLDPKFTSIMSYIMSEGIKGILNFFNTWFEKQKLLWICFLLLIIKTLYIDVANILSNFNKNGSYLPN